MIRWYSFYFWCT